MILSTNIYKINVDKSYAICYVSGMKEIKETKNMKTLIKIVKLIDGYEMHFRIEGKDSIEIEFVERPSKRGK